MSDFYNGTYKLFKLKEKIYYILISSYSKLHHNNKNMNNNIYRITNANNSHNNKYNIDKNNISFTNNINNNMNNIKLI